jgi:hypothetical protein
MGEEPNIHGRVFYVYKRSLRPGSTDDNFEDYIQYLHRKLDKRYPGNDIRILRGADDILIYPRDDEEDEDEVEQYIRELWEDWAWSGRVVDRGKS